MSSEGTRRLAVCLVVLFFSFDFVESHKPEGPGSSSHLVCISATLEVEVYLSNRTYSADNIPSELPQKADSPTILRNPCPSCDPSYTVFPLHSQQFIIPLDEKLYVMTLSTDYPRVVYAEEVYVPECSPLSLFKPAYFSDANAIMYIHCRSTVDSHVYFTGRLVISQNWEFVRMDNYDKEGIFMNYYDRDFDDSSTYFSYAEGKEIFMESRETANLRFFSLPTACGRVVRLTSLEEKSNNLLIECSTDSSTENHLVGNVYLFSLDRYEHTLVVQDVSYPVCPLRVSKNGTIVAIFAIGSIIAKNLYESDRLATHVETGSTIYDGQLVEFEDRLIAVYSTADGLYAVDLGLALLGKSPLPIRLNGSEGICVAPGCPLLLVAGDREIIATFDHQMMVFSLDSYKLTATVDTAIQPSRYFFHGPIFVVDIFPSTIITKPPPEVSEPEKKIINDVGGSDLREKVLPPVAGALVISVIVVLVVAGVVVKSRRRPYYQGRVRMSDIEDPLNTVLTVNTIPVSVSETELLIPGPNTGMHEQEPDNDLLSHYDEPLQISDLDNVNFENTLAVEQEPNNDQYIDRQTPVV